MFGHDWGDIGAISGLLVIFSIAYNAIVAKAEREGYIEGFVAFSVVIGVLVNIGAIAIFSQEAAALALWAFTCSGTVMAAGSVWRYMEQRKRGQDSQRGDES